MKVYIEPIGTLINAFSKLPGVGLKTAQRYAYKIVNMPPEEAEAFASGDPFGKEKRTLLQDLRQFYGRRDLRRLPDEKRGRHLRGEGAERRHRHRKAERI